MRLDRWLRSSLRRTSAILLYHRVAELAIDPWGLAVSAAHFAEHLDILGRRATVLPLPQLIARVIDGTAPRRSVAVTFDDGYADNLSAAKPLLERHHAPAAVFVTTGQLDAGREFWWDELEALLLTDLPLPSVLELVIGGERHRWNIGESTDRPAVTRLQHTRWRAWMEAPSSRHTVFIDLWGRLRLLAEPVRRTVLNDLWAITGRGPVVRPSHRTLSTVELRELAAGSLIDIGAHTVTHSRSSALPESDQRTELAGSQRSLESLLGVPVPMMSYPFGSSADYTALTISLARETGFRCAFAAVSGRLRAGLDLFQIPRCFAPDVGGDRFEELLDGWFAHG